jgi:hypothetical protein
MQSTYIPLNGKEYDVEITKISKDGQKFGMKIISADGRELNHTEDRDVFVKIANLMRQFHKEVIAEAKMFFSGRMTEQQRMNLEIEKLMNGE